MVNGPDPVTGSRRVHDGRGKENLTPLTREQQKRVEESMHLVDACVRIKYRRNTTLDYDVLYSQACMGLVHAARKWVAAKIGNGEAGWKPYAVQRINWYMLKLWRSNSTDRFHIKSCGQPLPDHADQILQARPENEANFVVSEQLAATYKCLSFDQHASLMMVVGKGLTLKEAGSYLGLCRERVRQLIEEAKTKARKALEPRRQRGQRNDHFKKMWMIDRQTIDRWRTKGVQNSSRNRHRRAVLSAVFNRILPYEWYAIDHDRRTITGPYKTRAEAERRPPKVAFGGGAEFGWATLPYLNAKILDRIAHQPLCTYKIARELGLSVGVARSLVNRLKNSGLVAREGVCQCRRVGKPGVVWKPSDKALEIRGPRIVGVEGRYCQPFKDQGYTALPAKKLERRQRHAV